MYCEGGLLVLLRQGGGPGGVFWSANATEGGGYGYFELG